MTLYAMSSLVVGQELSAVADVKVCWQAASTAGAEFLALPLFHPRNTRDASTSQQRLGPGTRSDKELDGDQWISHVIGCISSWIDVDNDDINIRKDSEYGFKQETSWAMHLGLQIILFPRISRSTSPNLSRLLKTLIARIDTSYQQLWIRIPLASAIENDGDNSNSIEKPENSWLIWDTLNRMTGFSHKLSIALELVDVLLSSVDVDVVINRWIAEPVKALIIPTRLFVINLHGYPVLSEEHQYILSFFFNHKMHVVLTGKSKHDGSMAAYIQYLRFLKSKVNSKPQSFADKFTEAYKDTLQAPLQPLMDNLESSTYATFERDPTKYMQYQAALTEALGDIKKSCGDIMNLTVTIFVVGAGRGPLVACAQAAAIATDTSVRIIAVEKNENAIVTLRNRAISENWTNVDIVACDMRHWQSIVKADIIVSELLGSFGCNELSPECMDGVQQYLKPGGIMIPSNYTSYIAPVSTARLWMGVRDMPNKTGLGTPFVVKFHRCNVLSEAKPVFIFTHPKLDINEANTRYEVISFQCPYTTTIHGFQGTFESQLYGSVLLSIRPDTFTKDMFSWFPIFFPLATPQLVHEGERIRFHMWRCMDSRRVWFEWCLTSPVVSEIQNANGNSYWIGI